MNFKNIALSATLLLVATACQAANDKVDERIRILFATAQPLMAGHPGYKKPIMVEEDEALTMFYDLGNVGNKLEATENKLNAVIHDRDCYRLAFVMTTVGLAFKLWYDCRGRTEIDQLCRNIRSLVN